MQFRAITIENLQEIKKYLAKANSRDCNYSPGNLITWGKDLDISYAILRETIVFRTFEEKEVIYHVAEFHEGFLQTVRELCEDEGSKDRKIVFASLTKEMKEAIQTCWPDVFCLEYDRDGSDYVYEVDKLAALSGKAYHKKKNHVNRFRKNYDFSYEPITEENRQECLEMAEVWRRSREITPSLAAEAGAITEAFRYYEELGFEGGLIRVDGRVMAFTLGERVTEDTFVTHFEKALDEIPELYAVINQQFAENQLQGYRYVNREEDLGLEGLRKAKESYHPAFLVEKYKASLKSCCVKKIFCLQRIKNLSRPA